MEEGALVIAFLVVVGLLLLGVALFILLDDPDSSTAAAAAPAEPSSSSTASAAAASASSGSSSSKQIRNEYRSGMRVEEIISWRAADAVRALPEFAADEPEELLANLPKIIEALLGLDTSQAATGWLNQQAELSNPMLNPKLAVELQASLFRLLSADGERSVVARLLAEYSADRSAPAVRQRPVYNFFTSQLTAAAVRALEVGQPGLMPAIFANLLPPGALHHAWPVQSFAAPLALPPPPGGGAAPAAARAAGG